MKNQAFKSNNAESKLFQSDNDFNNDVKLFYGAKNSNVPAIEDFNMRKS